MNQVGLRRRPLLTLAARLPDAVARSRDVEPLLRTVRRQNTLDRALPSDPTGTSALRATFRGELDKRWSKVRRLVQQALADPVSGFAVEPSVVSIHAALAGGNRVESFKAWLDEAMRQVVFGFTGAWLDPYIDGAFRLARKRASTFPSVTTDAAPEEREQAILDLTRTELQGIIDAVTQQAIRRMAHGMLANENANKLARAVGQVVDKIGKQRSHLLANAIVVKAFSSATLDAFRRAGITRVGTVPEREKVKVARGPHGKHVVDAGPEDEPRDEHGRWTGGWSQAGEAYHGTFEKNLKSILKKGIVPRRIPPYEPQVYIAPDTPTAALFAGSKHGDASRVLLKIAVPAEHREKFQNYSFAPATMSALAGNVRIRPEWIKAWAPIKHGSFEIGEWNHLQKARDAFDARIIDQDEDEDDLELELDPELRHQLLVQEFGEGGEVDVLTAGDDNVCAVCEDISDAGPYDLDEAESLIPAHPSCRCAFVPTDDERFAPVGDAEPVNINAAGILHLTPDGRGLFMKRRRSGDHGGDHGGEWSIPAGGIEAGEDPRHAAHRESVEETGWPGDHNLRHLESRNGFHTYINPVAEPFEPIMNGEHTAFAWRALHEPPSPLHPGLASTLRALKRKVVVGDYNPYHEPAGSPEGGQFASKEGSAGAGGDTGRPGGTGRDEGLAEAQRAAAKTAGGATKLAGLPDKPIDLGDGTYYVPGPFGKAHDAARAYMREAGLPYHPPTTYAKVDKERAARIANAFDQMKHEPDSPAVKASYDAMIKETLAQWEAIKQTGLHVEWIKPGQDDPYAKTPRLAQRDATQNNHWWGYPTEFGFGTEGKTAGITDNPLLQKTGEIVDGRPVVANDIFRIVHDYFGHIKDGNGFRAEGEENAWRSHSAMYSDLARAAMTSETRGQNSWVNFGPYGEANKTASAADTVFAPQKIGLLPQWAIDEGRKDSRDAALRDYNEEHQPAGAPGGIGGQFAPKGTGGGGGEAKEKPPWLASGEKLLVSHMHSGGVSPLELDLDEQEKKALTERYGSVEKAWSALATAEQQKQIEAAQKAAPPLEVKPPPAPAQAQEVKPPVAAAELHPHVVSVGGDEWNKTLALKLETEYQQAKPELEKIAQEQAGFSGEVEAPSDEDEDEEETYTPEEWDSLSGDQQTEAEDKYVDDNLSQEMDYQVESWHENGDSKLQAAQAMENDFNEGQNIDWAKDALHDYLEGRDYQDQKMDKESGEYFSVEKHDPGREEQGLPRVPYSEETLLRALTVDAPDDGYYKSELPEPDWTWDDKELKEPIGYDPSQLTLPGIEKVEPAEHLTPEMREGIEKALTEAWEKQVEKTYTDMEAPDYLADSAKESLGESFDTMSDEDKFKYWQDHVATDEELGQKTTYGKSDLETATVNLNKLDPMNETSGNHYRGTQKLAREMSLQRSEQIAKSRGIKPLDGEGKPKETSPDVSFDQFDHADSRVWNSWKGSSSSPESMAMQMATSDELGGRFRNLFGSRNEPQKREDLIKFANSNFRSIGGYEGLKAAVRAKWETSQYMLERAGINKVEVYRGIELEPVRIADQYRISEQAAGWRLEKSYSQIGTYPNEEAAKAARMVELSKAIEQYHLDNPRVPKIDTKELEIAKVAGRQGIYSYEQMPNLKIERAGAQSTSLKASVSNGWDGDNRTVLRIEAPRTAVISVPAYGKNVHSEREVVLAGTAWSKWDAWHTEAPSFDEVPL